MPIRKTNLIEKISTWQKERLNISGSLGFVPTMGNLHPGHLSLIEKSIAENDVSVVSIFVNPKQFNQSKDFQLYPRTTEQDIALLEQLGVDYCILPDCEEVYPKNDGFLIQENALCSLMEGKHRPGHFFGVLTVVMKLLNIVQPDNVYMGEKDYQQYLLIKNMVASFFMKPDIIPCPTIRETSGLAFSSRNNRLTSTERKQAELFADIFHEGSDCSSIRQALERSGIKVDYIEEYLDRRYAAVFIGDIRLIDNYSLSSIL